MWHDWGGLTFASHIIYPFELLLKFQHFIKFQQVWGFKVSTYPKFQRVGSCNEFGWVDNRDSPNISKEKDVILGLTPMLYNRNVLCQVVWPCVPMWPTDENFMEACRPGSLPRCHFNGFWYSWWQDIWHFLCYSPTSVYNTHGTLEFSIITVKKFIKRLFKWMKSCSNGWMYPLYFLNPHYYVVKSVERPLPATPT